MEAWKPYEEVRNHPPDFRIRYRFFTEQEGGRKNPVYQGLRCDFSYDGDNIRETGIFAIHPEFEDELGNVILDRTLPIPQHGTARMWILFPQMRREVHIDRIKLGVIGYFVAGARRLGQLEVIEILGLYENSEKLN
ncbi:hypothetical protein [Paenibacillus sedimenti]|uniref:Uncharacterized protein n=1 Tax=Paenibacillus sedimenti TaxID=2770274 RepID=A0A926KZB5_9BACL|nr:hypothetical protein [Paenibacillus sedimenti]MBD0384884.1 hypothetical protein [Paenibacillus sedimenti]